MRKLSILLVALVFFSCKKEKTGSDFWTVTYEITCTDPNALLQPHALPEGLTGSYDSYDETTWLAVPWTLTFKVNKKFDSPTTLALWPGRHSARSWDPITGHAPITLNIYVDGQLVATMTSEFTIGLYVEYELK